MPTQIEIEFRAQGGGLTQNDRLASYLRSRPNQWIPMPELARIITATGIGAAVHSRIADCRKRGMQIAHRNERKPNGQVASFYFYSPDPG